MLPRYRSIGVDHGHFDLLPAPFFGFGVGREKHIQLVPLNRAAGVDDRHGSAVGVAGDDELGVERQDTGVGGDEEAVVVVNLLPAGGDALGVLAAALFARAVGRHFHGDGFGLRLAAGCFVGSDEEGRAEHADRQRDKG